MDILFVSFLFQAVRTFRVLTIDAWKRKETDRWGTHLSNT